MRVVTVRLARIHRRWARRSSASRLTKSSRDVRRRDRLRRAPVPSVEWRVVARIPGFAQPGLAEVPVGAYLSRHDSQVVPEIHEGGAPPEPVAVVEAVDG